MTESETSIIFNIGVGTERIDSNKNRLPVKGKCSNYFFSLAPRLVIPWYLAKRSRYL